MPALWLPALWLPVLPSAWRAKNVDVVSLVGQTELKFATVGHDGWIRTVAPASSASLPFAVAPESPMMLALEASLPRRSQTVLLGVAVTVPVMLPIERVTDRMANDAVTLLALSVHCVSLV